MPFTPSHAAAVLPLLRTGLPASAMLAGSVAPDLPYFLPGEPDWPTHTWLGVIGVDVALAAAIWLLWHGLLAAPALAVAPRWVRGRIDPASAGLVRRVDSPGRVLGAVVGFAVGAATHLIWDDFTHAGRFGPDHLAVLSEEAAGLPGYQWAQYASGVFGLVVVAVWVVLWCRRTPARPVPTTPATTWVYAGMVGTAVVAGVVAIAAVGTVRGAGFLGARVGGVTLAVLALAGAVLWHLRARTE